MIREERSFPWVEKFGQDVRYRLRMLWMHHGFTVLSVAIIGIGATTAIFSIVNGVVLRPLAFPESGRTVALYETGLPQIKSTDVTPGTFFAWQRDSRTPESVALTEGLAFVLAGVGGPGENSDSRSRATLSG